LKRTAYRQAYRHIDIDLKRRLDIILKEIHDDTVLALSKKLSQQYLSSSQRIEIENKLTNALIKFPDLTDKMSLVNDSLVMSKSSFNSAVTEYNYVIGLILVNLVAFLFRFKSKVHFQ